MDPIETVPAMALAPQDITQLVEELREYHRIDSPLFQRREQREGAEKYLHGLLLDIPRQSIEPMVLALDVADPNAVRALQLFISEGAWPDEALLKRHWQEVEHDGGDPGGASGGDRARGLARARGLVGATPQRGDR